MVEKLNPAAEPNPDEAAGALEVLGAKEKEEAETAEEEEPNPEGGCAGSVMALPKPAGDDGAAVDPNPVLAEAKLKVLAWTGAAAAKALFPKADEEDPNPDPVPDPKPPEDCCGAGLFNSASKAVRVAGLITFSSWTLLLH